MKDSVNNYTYIDKTDLTLYYSNHTPKECMEKYNIPTLYLFNKLLDVLGISRRTKNDIIKDMHNNMSEEKREIRKKKWQAYRTGRPVKEETKIKIGNGNRGKYRGGGTGKIVSPLKGQTKETNAALRRMSEERKK